MINYNTIVETDSLYEDQTFMYIAVDRIVRKLAKENNEDYRMLVLRAFDVASNMHRECGDKLFGKPTPFIRKLFMKFLNLNPNYTRIDVSLVDGKAYPYEKEVFVNFTPIAI